MTGNCLFPGIHTNDEAPISSTKLKNIVCTSADDISDLLDAATVTAWDASGSQAWTYVRLTWVTFTGRKLSVLAEYDGW